MVNATVPLSPLTLVSVIVELAEEPAGIVRLVGFADIRKSGVLLVEKMAVWTVSRTEVGVPFAMVTHTFGLTLVDEQPVWNPIGVPEVVPVTL